MLIRIIYNINVGNKVVLNPEFIKNGNMISYNKTKKGKLFFRIPCLVEKILEGGYYIIKINTNYLQYNLKKGKIYKVYYKLIKICTEYAWKDLCDNFENKFSDCDFSL